MAIPVRSLRADAIGARHRARGRTRVHVERHREVVVVVGERGRVARVAVHAAHTQT